MGYFTDNNKDNYMSVLDKKDDDKDFCLINEMSSPKYRVPVARQNGELMVIAAYIHVESQSDVKVRTALSEIRSSLHKSFEDCGKDVRIIVLPTTGETKIECIYPKQ
jgi:hypothetical protein